MVEDQPKEKKHFTVVMEQIGITAAKVLIWALLAFVVFRYFQFKYVVKPLGWRQFFESGLLETNLPIDFASPKAFEYGQIARNNLRGQWFRTDVIRPISLWFNRSVFDHPDLFHPPAYSVALAGAMMVFGVRDSALLWGSGAFFFLMLPVLYFSARAMFNRRTARLSLFFVLIMPAVGIAAVSGTPAMMAAFLITALFGLLHAIRPRRYLLTALAGAVLGACALTAARYIFLLVPAIGYLALTLRRRAWAHGAVLAAVAALVVFPWALRTARLTRSPWPPMEWTSSYQLAADNQAHVGDDVRPALAPPHTIERSFSPAALGLRVWGKNSARVLVRNLRMQLNDLLRYGAQSLLVILFFAGVLVRLKTPRADWLRIALYVAVLTDLIYGAAARPDSFLLLAYMPLMVVIGTATFFELIDRLGYTRAISRFALVAAATVVVVVQTLITTNPAEASTRPRLQRFRSCYALHRSFEGDLEPEAVVLTNVPWYTAWYLDRPSVWLPPSYEDLIRLRMHADESITFAYLAEHALNPQDPSYGSWERGFTEGRMPDSFGLVTFRSTMFSDTHYFTSFISQERLAMLLEEARKSREATEPQGDESRYNQEQERHE